MGNEQEIDQQETLLIGDSGMNLVELWIIKMTYKNWSKLLFEDDQMDK